MPRYSLDLTDDERDQLQAMAKEEERSMMSIMRVIFRRGLRVCISASLSRQSNVTSASDQRQNDACPSPTLAQARTVPEKKEEKGQKKKKEESGLAPLPVSKEVIGYLNELIGPDSKQQHTAKSHRTLIQARLSAGATVDDLKTVIRKKCEEWLGTPMQSNLRPSCLFRASNFDGYLGQPDAVKQSYGKKNHVQRMTEAQDQGEWSWEGVE